MTSNSDIVKVCYEGVTCKADAGVADGGDYSIQFLSIYGAPQQTKAIFSALAASRDIAIDGELYSRPSQAIRYKVFTLGYAKSYGVIYTEDLGHSIILWTSPEEKERRLRQALSKCKIPYDKKDLWQIEKILRNHDNLIPLRTITGSITGYRCEFNENEICDHLVRTFYRKGSNKVAAA